MIYTILFFIGLAAFTAVFIYIVFFADKELQKSLKEGKKKRLTLSVFLPLLLRAGFFDQIPKGVFEFVQPLTG